MIHFFLFFLEKYRGNFSMLQNPSMVCFHVRVTDFRMVHAFRHLPLHLFSSQIGLINFRVNKSLPLPPLPEARLHSMTSMVKSRRSPLRAGVKEFPGEIQDAWPRLTLTKLHSCETAAGLLSVSCIILYDW